jgi:hypothetical protein
MSYLLRLFATVLAQSAETNCPSFSAVCWLLLVQRAANRSRNSLTFATRCAEVKQKLYKHSMGSWTRYQHQLEPMIAELKKQLPKLKKLGALPYADKMNWKLDPAFSYQGADQKQQPQLDEL